MRDALLHELTSLQHLERDEAVEHRERGLAEIVGDRFVPCPAERGVVLNRGDELLARKRLGDAEVDPGLVCDRPVEADVVDAFELLAEFTLE